MVFIPAVRVDTDWNSAAISLLGTDRPPIVLGFDHSSSASSTAPPTQKMAENCSTTFAWRERRRFLRYSASSTQTMNPKPPAMIINLT